MSLKLQTTPASIFPMACLASYLMHHVPLTIGPTWGRILVQFANSQLLTQLCVANFRVANFTFANIRKSVFSNNLRKIAVTNFATVFRNYFHYSGYGYNSDTPFVYILRAVCGLRRMEINVFYVHKLAISQPQCNTLVIQLIMAMLYTFSLALGFPL